MTTIDEAVQYEDLIASVFYGRHSGGNVVTHHPYVYRGKHRRDDHEDDSAN